MCFECGYDFDLSCATHKEMLEASKLSFDKADSSLLVKIFSRAVMPYDIQMERNNEKLNILTSDDLMAGTSTEYDYYGYNEHKDSAVYNEIYKAKINMMDAEKDISDAKKSLKGNDEEKEQCFAPIVQRKGR